MFRRGFVVVSMLVVSFAAALLGAADVRAELYLASIAVVVETSHGLA